MAKDKIELIIVFKKEIEQPAAENFLKKSKVIYREGMDSSRGKIYFYSTGPKFILTLRQKKKKEISYPQIKKEEVYEIYEPDWDKRKD